MRHTLTIFVASMNADAVTSFNVPDEESVVTGLRIIEIITQPRYLNCN